MNKRQAKKKRKFREDQEYYLFMSGMLPLNLRGCRRVKRWLKIELNEIKKESKIYGKIN